MYRAVSPRNCEKKKKERKRRKERRICPAVTRVVPPISIEGINVQRIQRTQAPGNNVHDIELPARYRQVLVTFNYLVRRNCTYSHRSCNKQVQLDEQQRKCYVLHHPYFRLVSQIV